MMGPAVGEKVLSEEGLGDPNCSAKAWAGRQAWAWRQTGQLGAASDPLCLPVHTTLGPC